jgi:benzoyl-CoA reductase/2-hydroxyglutaryl-CoA dehydratase subunit BcrC/BadD/HgdB
MSCCPRGQQRAGQASSAAGAERALAWFEGMIGRCLDYATEAKERGRPIVGILCEYTPRELIMAAGGVPVCLCGGSAETISAAERELPSNLCPLIKSTYGYHVLGANPFLEMADLVVGETTCDGKKKMLELLAQRVATHVVELPQKPDDADARVHWGRELVKLRQALSDRFGVAISDGGLREAIRAMNRERGLRRSLAALMRCDSPPLTGRELLSLKSTISCLPDDLAHYESALASLPRREGSDQSHRVRVLLTGVPVVHGAERVVELIEDRGGLIVCQENCTGLKPILDDVDESAEDPMEALTDKYFGLHCSVMTPNRRRFDALRQLAADYRPDCVIELIWQACLTYSVESRLVRGLVEKDLGLPYLMIETDYSPSDSERIAVRVEALFETVRARKRG